ncbi:hypothetical protein GCM10009716_39210 [Streptomyces sodiiphilus]|uniref:Uncharacterized protein n=1 Tax=Streptomyces sodiiphilus TaxID=226217 RepID=A0ABN2PQH7_9ACTN
MKERARRRKTGPRKRAGEWRRHLRFSYADVRRPPPGGRAGVVFHGRLGGGEESGRVSTVANDP